jgi:hydrogenase maturation protease
VQGLEKLLVVGVGNDFRRDDAAGLVAARRLRDCGILAEEHRGDFATLMERWKDADILILIDAIAPGRTPGAVHRLNASASPLDREVFNTSTHAFGLADALELSRILGTLPRKVLVFGIEAKNLAVGVGLSPEVEANLPMLVKEVLDCVSPPLGMQ